MRTERHAPSGSRPHRRRVRACGIIGGRGRLAQLVARFVHTEEVVGSSPASPTARRPCSSMEQGLRRSPRGPRRRLRQHLRPPAARSPGSRCRNRRRLPEPTSSTARPSSGRAGPWSISCAAAPPTGGVGSGSACGLRQRERPNPAAGTDGRCRNRRTLPEPTASTATPSTDRAGQWSTSCARRLHQAASAPAASAASGSGIARIPLPEPTEAVGSDVEHREARGAARPGRRSDQPRRRGGGAARNTEGPPRCTGTGLRACERQTRIAVASSRSSSR